MALGELFPKAALCILRQTCWNPQATSFYDGLSGGIIWSDEFSREAIDACMSIDNWAFRYVLAYRASLIRGEPREELRAPWDQLVRECPDWPGLRPERRAPELRERLDAEESRFLRQFDEFAAQDNGNSR
jgi:hypothetical protein